MAVEKAEFIKQLDVDLPLGGDSLSEGDDHIRLIKEALTGSFPEIDSAVTATPAQLNDVANIRAELDILDAGSHGNAASCYYNPLYEGAAGGVTGLIYNHNVVGVVAAGTPEVPGTRVLLNPDVFPDLDPDKLDGSHFAYNFTPVEGTGIPIILNITSARDTYIGFTAWQLNMETNTWDVMPSLSCGFTLTVVDMDAAQ